MKISLLKKKRATQSKAEKNFLSYANVKDEQKGVAEVEFEIMSFHWCMRIFCAFECKLLEFQQLFLLSCAAHPNCSFLLFNGGRLLNEIIHATIAFGGLSHCSWKRGKIIVQFLTALMRLRRVLSNLLWLNSCELITHRILSLPRC